MRTLGYKLLKINIDEETLLRSKYTLAEFLVLLLHSLEIDPTEVQESLWNKGDLIKEAFSYSIHSQGEEHLKELVSLCTPIGESNIQNFNRIENLAKKLIAVFPTGRKPGTSNTWRGSVTTISARLKTLISKHKVEFSDDEAIEAAKSYVESFNGNYAYMRTLPYFIYKNEKSEEGVEFKSDMLDMIANKEDVTGNNDDWTIELK